MKRGWLLYDERDLAVNRDFAALCERAAAKVGLALETVCTNELTLGVGEGGRLLAAKAGSADTPDFVVSRQRDAFVSRQFELMDVPVFNGSRVCELCNDKRKTHQLLQGLPMLPTRFVADDVPPSDFPCVVKPANGHGGDRVSLVQNEREWRAAMADILPQPAVEQRVAELAGRDLRVYVLFGEIIAGVMRTAKSGVVSNFKRGGSVAAHALTSAERSLARQVIDRFEQEGAPLCLAGVDLLYRGEDNPVLGEVEDVVGSRMLYATTDIDIVALYFAEIARRLG